MMTVLPTDLLRILPEIILGGFGTLIMLLDPFLEPARRFWLGWLALVGILAAAAGTLWTSYSPGLAFGRSIAADRFSFYFFYLFLLVAALTVLGSIHYLERDGLQRGEFYALLLLGASGMCFMASSTDLIMVFIGLEISSISTYILVGFRRSDTLSNEASFKYYLLGSFATAFFLYGIAFIYGLTGTTNLIDLSARLASPAEWSILARVALLLMFVGLAFKLSTVPFQIWTPDVYQGAPAPVTAFLSVGPKAAAFAVLLRVFLGGFASAGSTSFWLLWVSAIMTMSLGNLAALWQTNVKRLLAYSAIAQAGYVLVGVAAGSKEGASAVLFYLTAYALMNVGVFVLVAHLAGNGEAATDIGDYTGLAYVRPGAAACLTVFLISLAGFPTTAGFFGKLLLFRAALHSHLIGLTIIALLNSVVSVYYYLRIVVAMYMREGETRASAGPLPGTLRTALLVSVAGIFTLGLFPSLFVALSSAAGNPLP
jgi:NADH-quinone oxidoreductase subunit N